MGGNPRTGVHRPTVRPRTGRRLQHLAHRCTGNARDDPLQAARAVEPDLRLGLHRRASPRLNVHDLRVRQLGDADHVDHLAVSERGQRLRHKPRAATLPRQDESGSRSHDEHGSDRRGTDEPGATTRAPIRRLGCRDCVRDRKQLGRLAQQLGDFDVQEGRAHESSPAFRNSSRTDSRPRANRILHAASVAPTRRAISANDTPCRSFITTTRRC
jgi:hypothetical protein